MSIGGTFHFCRGISLAYKEPIPRTRRIRLKRTFLLLPADCPGEKVILACKVYWRLGRDHKRPNREADRAPGRRQVDREDVEEDF